MLLHDEQLWAVLDNWVSELKGEVFTELLPLLRRTFASFPAGERRQMGERVKGQAVVTQRQDSTAFDEEAAVKSLALVAKMLGLEYCS